MKRRTCSAWALVTLCACSISSGTATALAADETNSDDKLQEIVVTAEKREVTVKDLPIAIYAATGKELAESGVSNVQDLPQLATGLQFGTQSNTTFASIRGVGSEIPDLGGEAAVAITQDGLPLAHPQMFNADFLDVGHIEVLRGPQGTIAGRNASAGAINVVSNQPTPTMEGNVRLGIGSYNDLRLDTVLSGPLIDDVLLGRIAFSKESANGWWHNQVQESPQLSRPQDTNDADRSHLRLSLLAKPSDELKSLLTVEYLLDESIPQQGVYLNTRTAPENPNLVEQYNTQFGTNYPYADIQNLRGASDFWQSQYIRQINVGLKTTWTLAPATSVTATIGYIDRNTHAYYDYDGTAAQISENAPIFYRFKSFTQEVTLLAKPFDSFDLIAGAIHLGDYGAESPLLFIDALEGLNSPGYATDGPFQRDNSTGVYGQMRYFPIEQLHIDVGARYSWDKKDYQFASATINNTFVPFNLRDSHLWSAFTPRAAIAYDVTPETNVYASVARGYKSGGYNTFAVPLATYNPEFVTTYEVGTKFQNHAIFGGLTVFLSQYKDIQQFLYRELTGTSFDNEIVNASAARIYGIEASLNGRVTDALRLFGNLSWTHARFTKLNTANPYTDSGPENLSGNVLPRAPTIQAVVGAEMKTSVSDRLNFVANTNFRYQTQQYNDLFDTPAGLIGAYGILNARAGVETKDGKWQVDGYVNNALDRRFLTNILISAPATVQGNVGAPRLYGITLARRF